MTQIPENEVTMQDLVNWQEMVQQLRNLKNAEMLLRKKIAKHYFPLAIEGTQKADLNAGYKLKLTLPYTRDFDMGALSAAREDFQAQGIPVESLMRTKYELDKKEYNTLTEEQRVTFDQVLIIKPGSPSLEIVAPKSKD